MRQVVPAVLDLLRHLETVGFEGAPRVIDGEVAWVDGLPSPHPHAWTDDQVVAVGALLRQLHEAISAYQAPPDAQWPDWSSRREAPDALGHGDLGPWNVVVRDGVPVAFVDWEFAGPIDRLDEVAEAAWLNCQLHDDDVAGRVGLPAAAARAKQLRLFADAYGLDVVERVGFVERMVAIAVRQSASEAVWGGVTRDGSDPTPLYLAGPLGGMDAAPPRAAGGGASLLVTRVGEAHRDLAGVDLGLPHGLGRRGRAAGHRAVEQPEG